MRNITLVIAGLVIAVMGAVFSLQGFGVLKGSSMSNTTTWSIAGPLIVVVGLVVAWLGGRKRV
ncbi:MAG: hypothetical protein ACTHJM_05965 [Marmoricola sp.]